MTENRPTLRRYHPLWLNGPWGVVALVATLYTLLYLAWLYFRWGGEENATLIGDLLYLPINLLATIAAWRVFTKKDLDPRVRRMWLLIGAGFLSYFLGSLTWTYLENVLEVPPFPSIADFFYLMFVPLATVGLFTMPSVPLSKRERMQYTFDMLIIVTTATLLNWYLIIQPTAVSYVGDAFVQAIAVAYPITDILIIIGIVGALLRHPDQDTKSVLWFLFTGMFLFVIADVIFGYTSLLGTYGPGSLADYCWAIAFIFFLLAALRQVYQMPATVQPSRLLDHLDRFAHMLPNILAGIGGIVATTVVITNFNSQTGWLIVGAVLVVILLIARQIQQPRIQTRLTALILVVTIPLVLGVTAFISSRAGQTIEEQASRDLEENNDALASSVSSWLEQQSQTLHEMSTLPDIVSMDNIRQRPVLQVIAAAHPNLFLVQTTDLTGFNVARNDDSELKDYSDRGWFLGAKAGTPITIEALISRTTGKPALNMSTPIRNELGQIIGVASIVSELEEISQEVLNTEEGRRLTFIVDPSNRVVAHPDPAYTEEELRDLSTYPPVAALRNGQTGLISFTDENGETWRAYVSTLDNGWGIIAQQPEAELLAPVRQFQSIAAWLIVVGTAIMLSMAWFIIRRTLRPIETLTETVSAIATGDLDRVAEVKNEDEIGILASTFNNMTSQLREMIGTLEQRVADRTKDLDTVAEVGTATSTILEVDKLLQEVVNLSKERFNLYHSHIYLLDEKGENLVLAAGAGEPGRQMKAKGLSIPLNREQSLVARAARERKGVTVNDVTQAPDFLPNPLLPNTRSELAVPMIIGDRVLGVLDVQSDVVGRFTDADVNIQTTMASQIAASMQNALQVEQTFATAAELAGIQNAISSAAIVAVTDVSGKILEANDNFTRISQYSREELIGQDHRILNSGYHSKEFMRDMWTTIANGKVWRGEIRNKAKDGSFYWVDSVISPILNETGKPIKYLAVRYDITQRKQLELETAKRAQELEMLDSITQKIQSTATVEAALQVAARELGHALGMKPTLVTLDPDILTKEKSN